MTLTLTHVWCMTTLLFESRGDPRPTFRSLKSKPSSSMMNLLATKNKFQQTNMRNVKSQKNFGIEKKYY